MIFRCKQHGVSHGKDFCPFCPPKIRKPTSSVSISFTLRELELLLQYWEGDVETMGEADAMNPSDPIQPTGQRIRDKLCKAKARLT
jgi:hypothetical protein